MVEILLNVAWLAIAFVISAAFLPRHRGRIAAVAAVACLIALLFPIVSISDDLAPARDAVEECGGVRRCLLSAACPLAAAPHSTPAVIETSGASFALAIAGRVEGSQHGARSLVLACRANPRSPPLA